MGIKGGLVELNVDMYGWCHKFGMFIYPGIKSYDYACYLGGGILFLGGVVNQISHKLNAAFHIGILVCRWFFGDPDLSLLIITLSFCSDFDIIALQVFIGIILLIK